MRRVRQLPPLEGKRLPAIALTAFARSVDRTRAIMAGYQMHMAKPIEPQELVATVASFAGRLVRPPGDEAAKRRSAREVTRAALISFGSSRMAARSRPAMIRLEPNPRHALLKESLSCAHRSRHPRADRRRHLPASRRTRPPPGGDRPRSRTSTLLGRGASRESNRHPIATRLGPISPVRSWKTVTRFTRSRPGPRTGSSRRRYRHDRRPARVLRPASR